MCAEAIDEPDEDVFDVDYEHDANDMYIDDGVVAQIIQYAQDDKFFN
jgi:hypothetical protein